MTRENSLLIIWTCIEYLDVSDKGRKLELPWARRSRKRSLGSVKALGVFILLQNYIKILSIKVLQILCYIAL